MVTHQIVTNRCLNLLKTEYHVFGMSLRPLWEAAKIEEVKDWTPFSDDLLQFLTTTAMSTPPLTSSQSSSASANSVIGVGHSIGGTVTLRAALRDPGKFRALVLMDPVLFVPKFMTMMAYHPCAGIWRKASPIDRGSKKTQAHIR